MVVTPCSVIGMDWYQGIDLIAASNHQGQENF